MPSLADAGPVGGAGAGSAGQGRGRLGIVAGGGDLPARIISACLRRGTEFFVVALKGEADRAALAGTAHGWFRIGQASTILGTLRKVGVTDLVFAGAVRRPSLATLRPDLTTARFFARLGREAFGDDGLLKAMLRAVEEEGFRIVGVESLLDDILIEPGLLTRREPDTGAYVDIRRGFEVAHELGRLDVGQAVIVQGGVVLGLEAVEGTDALIDRCAGLVRPGAGGVLVKAAKPQQDRRVDLPTIGRRTVRKAAAAGLSGIAVEAGAAFVIDRDVVAAEADRAGLFLVGIDPETLSRCAPPAPP